jgi:hypothetical protein
MLIMSLWGRIKEKREVYSFREEVDFLVSGPAAPLSL